MASRIQMARWYKSELQIKPFLVPKGISYLSYMAILGPEENRKMEGFGYLGAQESYQESLFKYIIAEKRTT